MSTCISEPVSWLRLERHAIARDTTVESHLAACAACRGCYAEITCDLVALRPLALPATAPPRRRWWVIPSFAGFAAAGTIVALLLLGRDKPVRDNVVAWKGGELVLGLIRERGGAITEDATTFRIGDRWKVVLTCAPGSAIAATVEVYEVGGYSAAPDRPLGDAATITCGNRIALPGAFSLTGTLPNRICARLDYKSAACTTVAPE